MIKLMLMASPLLTGVLGAIPVVGSIANSLIQAHETNVANAATINQQNVMYGRQRADAIADRDYQNAYNSPTQQMERLRAAGLNPNLVYGNGAGPMVSAQTRSSDPGSYRAQAPQPAIDLNGIPGILTMYQDLKMKDVQMDLLRTQMEVARTQAAQNAANTDKTRQDITFGAARQPVDLQQAIADVRATNTRTDIALTQNERDAAANAASVGEAYARIAEIRARTANTQSEAANIRAQYENLLKTGQLQQLDINLKKLGVQPNDALWQRMLAQLVSGDTSLPARVSQWAGKVAPNVPPVRPWDNKWSDSNSFNPNIPSTWKTFKP